jgi:hypothetical protein
VYYEVEFHFKINNLYVVVDHDHSLILSNQSFPFILPFDSARTEIAGLMFSATVCYPNELVHFGSQDNMIYQFCVTPFLEFSLFCKDFAVTVVLAHCFIYFQ